MSPDLSKALANATTLTFDCYGTLVDWRAGLQAGLREVFAASAHNRLDELFSAYLELEAEVEAETYRPYRQVLAQVTRLLAKRFDMHLPPGKEGRLADTLPQWPLFADTSEALARLKRKFRLGVLSNIDRDLFAATAARFPVALDFVVTAEDVRSYKPGLGHFRRYLEEFGERESTIHVAQSLYHDGVPTGTLGIPYVWINRYADE